MVLTEIAWKVSSMQEMEGNYDCFSFLQVKMLGEGTRCASTPIITNSNIYCHVC